MRSVNFILLFLIAILTTSFLFFNTKRDYVDMVHEIMGKASKKMIIKHGMSLVGVTEGMMRCIYTVGFSFQIDHPMNRDEVRYLLIDCTEEMLRMINQNVKIRPHLKNYPFTTENIKMTIFMSDEKGRRLEDPLIDVASIYKSHTIYYRTKDPNIAGYKNQYPESYEEALAIVKSDPAKYPLGFPEEAVKVRRRVI